MAMMMETHTGGGGIEGATPAQLTEILLSTVSGISTLRSAIGDHVLSELISLLLKDGRPPRGTTDSHLPLGLLDN